MLVALRSDGPKVRPVPHVRVQVVDAQKHRLHRHVVLLPPRDHVRRVRAVRGRVDVSDDALVLALDPEVALLQRAAPAREHGMGTVHDCRWDDRCGARAELNVAPSLLVGVLGEARAHA